MTIGCWVVFVGLVCFCMIGWFWSLKSDGFVSILYYWSFIWFCFFLVVMLFGFGSVSVFSFGFWVVLFVDLVWLCLVFGRLLVVCCCLSFCIFFVCLLSWVLLCYSVQLLLYIGYLVVAVVGLIFVCLFHVLHFLQQDFIGRSFFGFVVVGCHKCIWYFCWRGYYIKECLWLLLRSDFC